MTARGVPSALAPVKAVIPALFLIACEPLSEDRQAPRPAEAPTATRADSPLVLVSTAVYSPLGLTDPTADYLSVADRLTIHQLAASGTDATGISELLSTASAEPESPARTLTLTLLFERLTELDPVAAARTAASRHFGLNEYLTTRIFATAARRDARAALGALIEMSDTAPANYVSRAASAVLAEIRDDARLIGAWIDAVESLPTGSSGPRSSLGRQIAFNSDSLVAEGIAALIAIDMRAGFDRMLGFPDQMQSGIVRRIDSNFGTASPEQALEFAMSIPDLDLRTALRGSVFEAWGRTDPVAAMRYAASHLDPDDAVNRALLLGLAGGVGSAVSRGGNTAEILALAERLPFEVAVRIRSSVVSMVARNDPLAAAALLDSMAGGERLSGLNTVADAMFNLDPVVAFQWALEQQQPTIERRVLGRIARSDPELALSLVFAGRASEPSSAIAEVVQSIVDKDPAAAPGIARRLTEQLRPESTLYQNAVVELMDEWMREAPEAALDWATTEGSGISAAGWTEIIDRVARNTTLTAAYAGRVPAEVRGDLLRKAAYDFANRNPDGAINWLQQFRADADAFELGMVGVIQQFSHTDVQRGARLLQEMLPELDARIARYAFDTFATNWAEKNPRAAANWAARLSDPASRQTAAGSIARAWTQQDSREAEGWILSLPQGSVRDEALLVHLVYTVREELPDDGYLAAFSSDLARTRAVFNVIANTADTEMSGTRAWLRRARLSPQMREQAEQAIDRIEQVRSGAGAMLAPGTQITIPVTLRIPETP